MKHVPLLIAAAAGAVMIFAYFVPPLLPWRQTAEDWFTIIAAMAMLLGGVNLAVHHLRNVSDHKAGWGFSAVTLIAFFGTLGAGLFKIGVVPEAAAHLNMPWSGPFQQEGSAFWWTFEYLYVPVGSTLFALLAFYVASAAFRAFRAKNLEAFLLLATAVIVLLGQTPDRVVTAWIPDSLAFLRVGQLTEFFRDTFVKAGMRAISIGIALGVAATSLRILLGLDRSYLGTDD